MADSPRLVAKLRESTRTGEARRTGRMPDELLPEQIQRLAVFSAVAGSLWAFALFMDIAVLPAANGTGTFNWRTIPVETVAALVSGVLCFIFKRSAWNHHKHINAGLAFMLINAIGIAALNAWGSALPQAGEIRVSWIAVLILIYSMIAPAAPRRMLIASLIAAMMDPLAFGIAALAGLQTPPLIVVIIMTWPNVACAFVAMVPSKVLQRIGRRLHEAQDLGSYHLLELLGTGGMGEVWRARHRLLARDAAIKLVRPELLGARTAAESKTVLRRFEREAQATAMLSSPHTIQVFDFGVTEDGAFYYVMELLAGRDLESLVREFGPLPASRVIYLLRQVAHSLADAHARGLVHRDVKPANIYVCRMGLEYDFAKVLDFGLVKVKQGRTNDTLSTIDHTTTGTPAYMAPETILGEVEVDRRADVYALGCVAYYLLTGQLVFEADTSMRMLMHHLNTPPVPPSQRTELPIPRELDEIVLACLQKDPDKRPQNAGELFRMAYNCRACEGWDVTAAEAWWRVHVPELTGPLAVSTGSRTVTSVAAV
ncbi:MAG TPA: serine/threonine-protein kinase [Vicinamibacterales bacterium]|nr:serine/threonine-protein kinase [Vicinamibacterales bacterium]